MFADDQIYLHLFKNSKNPDIECLQNLPTTFSWSLTPLSGTSWLSSYLYLTSPNPKSTPTPQGSYPNPAQTHILGPCLWNPSHFVSVPSASKSLLEIEAPMARHSAWQSHDNSGSLGCWMLIELNKQISVTWIGHHFQGVQIWVLRRLACYGVGLQGRGNESPVQVAPRELRDGFSSAPGSPLHSHFLTHCLVAWADDLGWASKTILPPLPFENGKKRQKTRLMTRHSGCDTVVKVSGGIMEIGGGPQSAPRHYLLEKQSTISTWWYSLEREIKISHNPQSAKNHNQQLHHSSGQKNSRAFSSNLSILAIIAH